jgi:DNA polymerase III subunit gamma/tau
MENFIVSARKYRPATFDTVVGQSPITSTLKNAIKNKHLAQAFLFCGPRGVGKTTCARILAKTINCFNRTDNVEACDQCDSCKSFNTGNSLNIFELDAASNNGVDQIRELVEQVRFTPQLGTHKIYIIDEVHMLSPNAFNAFLKTLEEPPAHAIFILATTEKHKIIPTILSRCQIFDFSRIQIDDIVKHLQHIAEKENIQTEVDGLHVIAQKADGALRDSLSMFDQIVTFTGSSITYQAVIENLHILDYDYYFKVNDAILNGNIPKALIVFDEILNNGFDGHNFLAGLSSHYRNLLVAKDEVTLKLLEVSQSIKEKYRQQSTSFPLPVLLQGLNVLNQFDQQYKSSKNQRLTVELALMNLCGLASGIPGAEEKKKSSLIPAPPNVVIQHAAEKNKQEKDVLLTSGNSSNYKTPASASVINEEKPSQKPVFKKPISIASHLNKNKTVTDSSSISEVQNTLPDNPVNAELLKDAWTNYATKAKSASKMTLYTTLTANPPELKEGNKIILYINNEVQREDLKLEQSDLLGFLKHTLGNNSLFIEVELIENEQVKKYYTSSDKFKRLSEKNPNIVKLKQKFDLEIE